VAPPVGRGAPPFDEASGFEIVEQPDDVGAVHLDDPGQGDDQLSVT
jgi:hypothetical protein